MRSLGLMGLLVASATLSLEAAAAEHKEREAEPASKPEPRERYVSPVTVERTFRAAHQGEREKARRRRQIEKQQRKAVATE